MSLQEVKQNLEMHMISAADDSEMGGVVENNAVRNRACDFTFLGGACKVPKVVGVLLGRPSDIIAGVPFYAEHHFSSLASFDFAAIEPKTRNGFRKSQSLAVAGVEMVDKKGYHTFRRGDVVEYLRKPDSADAALLSDNGIEAV
eukprot:4183582-Pleurochrysis_carterae.AAC.1